MRVAVRTVNVNCASCTIDSRSSLIASAPPAIDREECDTEAEREEDGDSDCSPLLVLELLEQLEALDALSRCRDDEPALS